MRKPRWPEPPPEVLAAGLRELAAELTKKYPHLEVVPLESRRQLPSGARYLPGALPVEVEAVLNRGKPRARKWRQDTDALDH
jgi:hypothetical protein